MRRQTFRAHAAWLATVTLAACASAKRNAPPEQVNVTPTTIRVETPSGTVEARTTAEDRATAITINVAPEVAWKNLPAVYGELQLPVNAYVDQTRPIGAKGAHGRVERGTLRMSQLM